jgi:hypothetical protein
MHSVWKGDRVKVKRLKRDTPNRGSEREDIILQWHIQFNQLKLSDLFIVSCDEPSPESSVLEPTAISQAFCHPKPGRVVRHVLLCSGDKNLCQN